MRLLLPLFALILATSCSHGATTVPDTKSDKAAPKAAKTTAPKAKTAASAEKASCKSADDVRSLEIVSKGTGCAVHYTKHEQMSEIATAKHETEHCKEVMQKIRGHLESAGFSCN